MQPEPINTCLRFKGGRPIPEYTAWINIKRRCTNPNNERYMDYGGREIVVCPEWLHDFAAFLAHVGPRTSADHSIDRIDNMRGYEPGNCRWATRKEQQRNRRTNTTLTAFGESMTAAAWSERVGLKNTTFCERLRRGWSVEDAVSVPACR